jgi:hypothetical protein
MREVCGPQLLGNAWTSSNSFSVLLLRTKHLAYEVGRTELKGFDQVQKLKMNA